MKERIAGAGKVARTSSERIRGAVISITRDQAEAVVVQFEEGNGTEVDSDTVQLLERFFLERDDAADLSQRFDEALKKYTL